MIRKFLTATLKVSSLTCFAKNRLMFFWTGNTESNKSKLRGERKPRHNQDNHRQICDVVQRSEKPQRFRPQIIGQGVPADRHIAFNITDIVSQHDIGGKTERNDR